MTNETTRVFEIVQTTSGESLGIYEGENGEAAIAAMLVDAGAAGADPDSGLRAVEVGEGVMANENTKTAALAAAESADDRLETAKRALRAAKRARAAVRIGVCEQAVARARADAEAAAAAAYWAAVDSE